MPTNKPVTKRYYPALSEMITVDDLPEFLQFAETGLAALLDKIHYKNFQFSKSARGDSAFYSLDIVTNNIGFDLPFGFRFVLNPAEDDSTISAFPISLQYQWEVLAFLRAFNIQNFAFTPDAFFDLGLKIFRISEDQVIAQVLNYFVENEDGTDAKFQDLIDAINLFYQDADLVLPPGEEPTVDMVAQLIDQSPAIPKSVSQVMFGIYISKDGLDGVLERLEQFYALMVPDGIQNYIKKLLEPKLRVTLKLSAGIEFPPNVLKPINQAGESLDDRSMFSFDGVTLYADTEAGIGADLDISGSLLPNGPGVLHEIGNTGLTIGFTEVKLDLSRKTNIPEADAAGYPVDFTGLYAKQVVLGFHRFGTQTEGTSSAAIIAENLFIGTGGVSGNFMLKSDGLLYRDFGGFKAELSAFELDMQMGSIVRSAISGRLTLNKLKQNGQDAVININAQIKDDGNFSITAVSAAIPPLNFLDVLSIQVKSLQLGKEDRGYYAEITGTLSFTFDIPGLGDVLPKDIPINKLRIWDNGRLEFEPGINKISIAKTFHLNIGPVKMEVNNISIAGHKGLHHEIERQYLVFAFDGMVNTGSADPAIIGARAASGYGGVVLFAMPHWSMAG